ncbi:MAG TPA: alpha/beta hydrolase [Cytophagaceae bacterium]|jgi:pimeloyl-ACP methyl ester carboxylesterase|nr:alpha/beta hydrolase [Cytophagaceae bacterium]
MWKNKLSALISLSVFSTGLIIAVSSCLRMRSSDKKLIKEFKSYVLKPHQHQYKACDRIMNYAEIGDDSLPVVIFVHGSPGSWTAFKDFFKDTLLLSKAKLVSVDRPGFGYSDYGHAEPSLANQAACILPLLKQYGNHKPVVLVGHSLGGPLIARLAMDYPDWVKALIFVAPSVDPDLEPYSWYRKPMNRLRWLLPGSIRASNQEIIPLKSELIQMLPLWKTIHQPCTVIQGDADDLVPPANAFFLQKMLVNSKVEVILLKGMNHFIPWKKPEVIQQAIFQNIK